MNKSIWRTIPPSFGLISQNLKRSIVTLAIVIMIWYGWPMRNEELILYIWFAPQIQWIIIIIISEEQLKIRHFLDPIKCIHCTIIYLSIVDVQYINSVLQDYMCHTCGRINILVCCLVHIMFSRFRNIHHVN